MGGSILFGLGYDVYPKRMLYVCSLMTLISYGIYVFAVYKNTGHIMALWAVTLMSYVSSAWLVLIFSNLREHLNRNYHISA